MSGVMIATIKAGEVQGFFEKEGRKESLAKLYCDVWREPPWNEDFWKEDEVKEELLIQNNKPGAVACYAVFQNCDYERVIGFTLGYQVDEEEMRKISSSCDLDYLFHDGKKVFYIDELAVERSCRCQGVASVLGIVLQDKIREEDFQLLILRTEKTAIPARQVYTKLGFYDTEIKDGKHLSRTYLIKEVKK